MSSNLQHETFSEKPTSDHQNLMDTTSTDGDISLSRDHVTGSEISLPAQDSICSSHLTAEQEQDQTTHKSQDKTSSEYSSWSVEKIGSEYDDKITVQEESIKSFEKWQNLYKSGLLVDGLWLVGASWNSDRYMISNKYIEHQVLLLTLKYLYF